MRPMRLAPSLALVFSTLLGRARGRLKPNLRYSPIPPNMIFRIANSSPRNERLESYGKRN